jgi:hypothetical protein
MSAETMKMPEPIIEPTTIITQSRRPRPRMNPSLGEPGELGDPGEPTDASDVAAIVSKRSAA